MDTTQESQIVFDPCEFGIEEEWNYDKWSNKEFDKPISLKCVDISRQNQLDADDVKKILYSSSSQENNIKFFDLKDSDDVELSKLKENTFKAAELRFLNLYKFYPIPKDPGLNSAFWILYPNPPIYQSDGIEKFFDLVKIYKLTPIDFLRKQLNSDELNLKYYNTDSKIIQLLLEALLTNTTIKTLNLQENYLTTDSCYYLNKLLIQSTVLKSLNLTACKIGTNGAVKLETGITNSSTLRDLNLNSCDLRREGLHYIVNAVTANTLLQSLNISNNKLDNDSAIYIEKLISQTQSLESLNLSWNNFNSTEACEMIFNSLAENMTILDIDLSWNSLGSSSFPYISQLISRSQFLKRINLTANRFSHVDGLKIAKALLANRCLQELILNKNPLGSQGVSEFTSILNSHEFMHCPLLTLDFGNLWATNIILPVLEKLQRIKPKFNIKIGGILGTYKIVGPNLKELFFKIANHEAMNCKKKKECKNFGLFILSLDDSIISKDKFMELLKQSKIKISDDLAIEIVKQFLVTKKTVDQFALKESYKSFFPDIKLPIATKINTVDSTIQSKGKKKKKNSKKTKSKDKEKENTRFKKKKIRRLKKKKIEIHK